MLFAAATLAAAHHFGVPPSPGATACLARTRPMFTLYQRDDCHLCDLALAVLAEARVRGLNSVFIDEDPTLDQRYGARVPVLRDAQGRELDWPFDARAVAAFVAVVPAGGRLA